MSIQTAPCEWPLEYGPCTVPAAYAELTDVQKAIFETAAAEYLWRWTGRSLGICEVTIRPCRDDCGEGINTFNGSGPSASGGTLWRPVIIDGLWYNMGCGRCGDSCDCGGAAPSLTLPGPIDSVTSVTIDGAVLDPAAYRVENHRFLIRQDGEGWPTCQTFALVDGSPGTWSVTYKRGVAVPVGGQVAAARLAIELWKASCGDASCGLPARVQSITRQGVTIAVLDSFDDIDKGHTGIWVIDSWVASMTQAPARAGVYSPDIKRVRRQTSP